MAKMKRSSKELFSIKKICTKLIFCKSDSLDWGNCSKLEFKNKLGKDDKKDSKALAKQPRNKKQQLRCKKDKKKICQQVIDKACNKIELSLFLPSAVCFYLSALCFSLVNFSFFLFLLSLLRSCSSASYSSFINFLSSLFLFLASYSYFSVSCSRFANSLSSTFLPLAFRSCL